MTAELGSRLRAVAAPTVATLVTLALLLSLGMWQLERKAWKEDLLAQIASRAHGPAGAPVPEARWPEWRANEDEFRRVRLDGILLGASTIALHGLAEERPGLALLGYYLFTPLKLPNGATVVVNRGFVPVEALARTLAAVREPSAATTVVGLVRAPEATGWFLPSNDPARGEWFVRDAAAMASHAGLTRVAPFYIDQDRVDNVAWPRGGQTQLVLRNPHLQYAVTWFGLAATLLGVYGVFALRRWSGSNDPKASPIDHAGEAKV